MTNRMSHRLRMAGVVVVVGLSAACNGLLDVQSPGRLADSDLNSKESIPGLVVGMSNRMANAMGSITDNMVVYPGLLSGEIFHGGSYAFAEIPRGRVDPEDTGSNWGAAQVARWVAEDGIRRMQDVLDQSEFDSSPYAARGYMFGAIANRILGENMCTAVIDGGDAQPADTYFTRGIDEATSAIQIGNAAGAGAQDEVYAAYAARASMKAWTGDWTGAVADAQQVPASFLYVASLQLPSPDNVFTYETHDRYEYTIFGTFMSTDTTAARENMDGPAWTSTHLDDPRAPWEILYKANGAVAVGANGNTPMYQQHKYDDRGADIPLVKGTEMLLLRAEAALRNSDIAGAYSLMNQARDVYGMDHLTAASDLATAWKDLHYERSATVWLEGRHLWDDARWYAASGPAHSDALDGRDTCLPISKSELDSNTNLAGYSVSHPLTRTK